MFDFNEFKNAKSCISVENSASFSALCGFLKEAGYSWKDGIPVRAEILTPNDGIGYKTKYGKYRYRLGSVSYYYDNNGRIEYSCGAPSGRKIFNINDVTRTSNV